MTFTQEPIQARIGRPKCAYTRAVRSSRRLVLLALALAALAVPSALAAKPAQSKCAKGAEKAGCKLPVGAKYTKAVKNGSANGTLSVEVTSKDVGVVIYAVYIHCTKYAPLLGDEQGIVGNYRGKQRPKVGKTYTITDHESQMDEDGSTSTADVTVTLNFKSAKKMVLKVHQVNVTAGEVGCDGSGSWTLKRQ